MCLALPIYFDKSVRCLLIAVKLTESNFWCQKKPHFQLSHNHYPLKGKLVRSNEYTKSKYCLKRDSPSPLNCFFLKSLSHSGEIWKLFVRNIFLDAQQLERSFIHSLMLIKARYEIEIDSKVVLNSFYWYELTGLEVM